MMWPTVIFLLIPGGALTQSCNSHLNAAPPLPTNFGVSSPSVHFVRGKPQLTFFKQVGLWKEFSKIIRRVL